MQAIDVTVFDSDTDFVKAFRPELKKMGDNWQEAQTPAGSSGIGHDPAGTPAAGSTGDYLRKAAQLGFDVDVVAMQHLRQFSTRPTSSGSGAAPGAFTIAGGVITALATGAGGTNWVNPRVLILGDGTGAVVTATVVAGVITGYVVVNGGINYTLANTTALIVDGPVVCVVGDSTATEAPTPNNPGETIWHLLAKLIREANPDKTITFLNRAVGGMTWSQFNGVATANFPAWYSNTSKAWLEYVKDTQADTVISFFGTNDRQNFVAAQMRASLNTLLSWDVKPDIIMGTPMVPHANSSPYDANMSSVDSQEGRDQVAGYTRGYSWLLGLGLLDINRQFRLVRDGIDVRASAVKTVLSASSQTLPFVSAVSGPDFAMEATFTGLSAGFWTGRQINFLIARRGVNLHQFLRVDDASGKLRVAIIEFTPGPNTEFTQSSFTTALNTPTSGSMVLQVLQQDQRVMVSVGGAVIYDAIIARMGGNFAPELSVAGAGVGAISISTWIGEPVRFNPRLNDAEIYGGPANVYRGNALNHPSALGVRYIVQPVLEAAEWAANGMTMGDIPSSANNYGWGVARPRAKYHFVNRPTAVTTFPAGNAATWMIEDSKSPGITWMCDPDGVVRENFGDTDNNAQFTRAFNHTNNTYSEIHNGTTVRSLTATKETMAIPTGVPTYTVAGLPAVAGVHPSIAYVSNEVGGAVLAFTDGTNWRRVTDRAICA